MFKRKQSPGLYSKESTLLDKNEYTLVDPSSKMDGIIEDCIIIDEYSNKFNGKVIKTSELSNLAKTSKLGYEYIAKHLKRPYIIVENDLYLKKSDYEYIMKEMETPHIPKTYTGKAEYPYFFIFFDEVVCSTTPIWAEFLYKSYNIVLPQMLYDVNKKESSNNIQTIFVIKHNESQMFATIENNKVWFTSELQYAKWFKSKKEATDCLSKYDVKDAKVKQVNFNII